MHGIIFVELKKFVEHKAGAEAWSAVVEKSGVPTSIYMAVRPYDDSELVALVQTASGMTGVPVPVLLKEFGTFIVPGLMKTYRAFMRPDWKTLDVLEFTESHIHTKVRTMTKGAMPPFLKPVRTAPNEVTIKYGSPRKLCPVAEGIITGIANHFGEKITMSHARCMLRGDAECELRVKTA